MKLLDGGIWWSLSKGKDFSLRGWIGRRDKHGLSFTANGHLVQVVFYSSLNLFFKCLLVQRLWCEDGCEVAKVWDDGLHMRPSQMVGGTTLTVSMHTVYRQQRHALCLFIATGLRFDGSTKVLSVGESSVATFDLFLKRILCLSSLIKDKQVGLPDSNQTSSTQTITYARYQPLKRGKRS